MIRARRSVEGFTLLELVVALAAFALSTALIAEAVGAGAAHWRRAVERSTAAESVFTARRFLTSRLRAAEPFRSGPMSTLTPTLPLRGTATELEFSGPAAGGPERGSARYLLRVRTTPAGRDLVVRVRRDWAGRVDAVEGTDAREEVLIADVRLVRFRYYTVPEVGEPQWRADWSGSTLPSLIEVDVAFSADDRRRWTRLVVRPERDGDALCAFDAVSRTCRSA